MLVTRPAPDFTADAVYPDSSTGRNVAEVLRVLDALQFHEKYGDVCPANWHPGDDGMKEDPDSAADYLARHC